MVEEPDDPIEVLIHCAQEVARCGHCEDCQKMAAAAIQAGSKLSDSDIVKRLKIAEEAIAEIRNKAKGYSANDWNEHYRAVAEVADTAYSAGLELRCKYVSHRKGLGEP
jgi:hypothetical protein